MVDVRFLCRLLLALFGLGCLATRTAGRLAGCADDEQLRARRERFRRRVREALRELLADEPASQSGNA